MELLVTRVTNMSLWRKLNNSFKSKVLWTFCAFIFFYYVLKIEPNVSKNITENLPTTTELNDGMDMMEISDEIYDQISRQNVTKIIILSPTPRSGSSYISEIIATVPYASLWVEPLRFLYEKPPMHSAKETKNNTSVKANKDKRYRLQVSSAEKLKLISDFMNCKFQEHTDLIASQVSRQFIFKLPNPALGRDKGQISRLMMNKVYLRKAIQDCQRSKTRIMKTIRLNIQDLISAKAFENYKVVVLFRDPRAIVTSIKLTPDFWTTEYHEPSLLCSKMNENLANIQQQKIRILKYEDFVSKSDESIEELFTFFGIPFLAKYAQMAVKRHKRIERRETKLDYVLKKGEIAPPPKPPKNQQKTAAGQPMNFVDFYAQLVSQRKRNFFKTKKLNTLLQHGTFRYYSTYRSPAFKHDHWKDEIPAKLLSDIQDHSNACKKAIKSLNYTYFEIHENKP